VAVPYSRRDFLISAFAGILSASTFSRSHFTGRTEHASASVSPGQFDIQKITSDVYFAEARPWALANSNAAIFVNSSDVLVVDSHGVIAMALMGKCSVCRCAQELRAIGSQTARLTMENFVHNCVTQQFAFSRFRRLGAEIDIENFPIIGKFCNLYSAQRGERR